MKTGIERIAAERARQISVEGWTPENDDQYRTGELIDAGLSYAYGAINVTHPALEAVPKEWPWDPQWWKPSEDPVRNLEKAGALFAAEIDRILRIREIAHICERCGGAGWVPSKTEADTDPCPVCAFPQNK